MERDELASRVVDLEVRIVKLKDHIIEVDSVSKELGGDCKWIINRRVPLLAYVLITSNELMMYMVKLAQAAYNNERMDGFAEGKSFLLEKKSGPSL
ncbi:hypothetical protein Hanom_Chr17g01565401 [Helianthus anomalus]